jgi:DNA-binding response OmpR family regulator
MYKKILVIGSDVETEMLLSRAFSDSGFQVLIMSGNGGSVSPSGLIGPDLIIFDGLLPGTPGWYTLRQIRQMSPVPIIVLTDVEDSQLRIKSLDLGADCCLSRPLDLDELKARVGVLLRRQSNTGVSHSIAQRST